MNAMHAMKPMQEQFSALVDKHPALKSVILEIAQELCKTRGRFDFDDILYELEARKLVQIKRPI